MITLRESTSNLFGFFIKQFEQSKELEVAGKLNSGSVSPGVDKESKRYLEILCKYSCGGNFLPALLNAGIDKEQINKAKEEGYLKHIYNQSTKAKQLGQSDFYALTVKGVSALYKLLKEKGIMK